MRDGKVVKGIRFRDHRVAGDILELAERYVREGADELVFYDITASPDGRTVDRHWVSDVAAMLDIPFCVAGGIRSIADAESVLNRGADKISINSPALESPDLITRLAHRFGSQCVVVGVDSLEKNGNFLVYRYTGDSRKSGESGWQTRHWVRRAQELGAGEIVLNCMNRDGVRDGYDTAQLAMIRRLCTVPLIASGGAGTAEHFANVFRAASVDGALAASVFHDGSIHINELKKYLHGAGVHVRY
ncbi:MAG TPA: imidazole glycerol phosphate synthase subunit HisF [Woeseiaceae bacterium]|nr:imidazole glycerol phosphate synthase subunit HisF [Woeseiaceae bacterium]